MDAVLAGELGIRDRVTFISERLEAREVAALMNLCDIYASPSRQEGFGRPLVEAQACGKPIITVAGTATKDLVIHGVTGFAASVQEECFITEAQVGPEMGYAEPMIVKFDEPKLVGVRASVEDIRDALHSLLADNELRARMGQAARVHALTRFHHVPTAVSMVEAIREGLRV